MLQEGTSDHNTVILFMMTQTEPTEMTNWRKFSRIQHKFRKVDAAIQALEEDINRDFEQTTEDDEEKAIKNLQKIRVRSRSKSTRHRIFKRVANALNLEVKDALLIYDNDK